MNPSASPGTSTRVLSVLAAVVIVLAGMRLAASFLNPLLFAVVFSTLLRPIAAWLTRRGLSTGLVLLLQFAVFGVLFVVLGVSLRQFTAQLSTYATQLDSQLAALHAALPIDLAPSTLNGDAVLALLGSIAAGIVDFLGNFLYIQVLMLFFVLEGPAIITRLRASVRPNQPQVARLPEVGHGVVLQFGLRAIINTVTGTAIALWLLLLGVDFPLLWSILTFFLSYIPYVGIVVATIPSMVLAFAEYGLTRALLVILGVTVANITAENVLEPLLMSRGLRMSPTTVFVAFAFWTWLLGPPGAILGLPITFFLVVMFATVPDTRWLAAVMTVGAPAPLAREAGGELSDSTP